MPLEVIEYTGKHLMRDNGVGDYDLFCGNKKAGFIPIMNARTGIKGDCPLCGDFIEPMPR